MRRVAVTGIGVVSPIGNSAEEVYRNAHAGRSGIHVLDAPFSDRLVAPLAATARFDGADYFEPPKLRMLDRVSQFALVAANQALADSCCDLGQVDRSRAGVFVGTGMGGAHTSDDAYKTLYGDGSDRIKPFTVLMGMHNAPAAWIGIEHELRGPNLTYSTACSSSAVAIGEAWLRLAGGGLDIAIAGGAEAPLSFGSLKAWEALHTATRNRDAAAVATQGAHRGTRAAQLSFRIGSGVALRVNVDTNTITITNGTTNISSVKLIDDHVILRSDNGSTAITIPDLWDYDNTQNSTEMLFFPAVNQSFNYKFISAIILIQRFLDARYFVAPNTDNIVNASVIITALQQNGNFYSPH